MRNVASLLLLCFFLFIALPVQAVPNLINYQGVLTDSGGIPLNQDISITFRLFDVATAGTAVWSETQTVTATNGVYNVQLGASTSLNTVDFTDSYWLEVEVGGEILTSRQALTSVPYAMTAANSIRLEGYTSADLLSWSNLTDIPADIADGDDSGVAALTLGASLIANDIQGELTLDVITPLELTASTDSATTAVIKGMNIGNGYGLYGFSGSSSGVLGTSNTGVSVEGLNGSTGNLGQMGTTTVGVYGKGVATNSSGVRGEYGPTGSIGTLGTSFSGVVGNGKGSANGVYGSNENGNFGYLGGAMYSLYSSAHDSNSYAGYFLGKTTISGGNFELRNSTGENWLSFLRGVN